jgi:tRNA1Val (adenine37-N6)-methyltransferase
MGYGLFFAYLNTAFLVANKPTGTFRFKQFNVDQSGCAMKVNTDGVLLGSLAETGNPYSILDIGTGTGVIALMLAQRFVNATVDGVEIDATAAVTANKNFQNSAFAGRMSLFAIGFEKFFDQNSGKKYDLIVSNPPFFLNSLESPGAQKNLAKHTNAIFFEKLISGITHHLTKQGTCAIILPIETAQLVKQLLPQHQMHLHNVISIKSFAADEPHRALLTFGKAGKEFFEKDFVIYDEPKVYSADYITALKPFFTIF